MALLRSATNMHRPLCSLPVEILTQIIDHVPKTDTNWSLEPFWYPGFQDSSSVLPLSRTCRRIRHITLSRSEWWQHLTSADDSSIPALIARSQEHSLNVVIKDHSAPTICLRVLYASITPRMHGLHFLCTDYARLKSFGSFLQLIHPELESFTCCAINPSDQIWQRRRLAINHDQFPQLRHLVLKGVISRVTSPLTTLTHLILSQVSHPGLHVRVARLLRYCPNLKNLVLSRLFQGDTGGDDVPQPLLPHLRRVVLHDLVSRSLRFYLSLTALSSGEVGLQILNVTANYGAFSFEPILSERLSEDPVMLGIGICLAADSLSEHTVVSITLATPVSALRIASTPELIEMSQYREAGLWVERILSERERLRSVQEVWLVDGSPEVRGSEQIFDFGKNVRAVISALPALETAVLLAVADHGEGRIRPPELSSCLPNVVDDPSFDSQHLKTLRLVCCDTAVVGIQGDDRDTAGIAMDASTPIKTLDLSRLLEELASSAYCYLENLVVQSTSSFCVSEEEDRQLREYFSTVSLERIIEPPRMPLPQCCVELDEGPGGSCTWTRPLC